MYILAEKEAEEFLERHGFPVSKRLVTRDVKETLKYCHKIGFPVALKIVSPSIIHKSDVGGVFLDLRNDKEVVDAFNNIKKIKGYEAVMVEKYTTGKFLLLGLKKDAAFGHAIAVGWGGIYTEVLKDISFRICPIDNKEAEKMLEELKFFKVLKGVRGEKPVNFRNIIDVIVKLSKLPLKYKAITELDINPMIADEKNVRIVDARIVFN